MAASRFSRQQLFNIRNHIPITRVIEALSIGYEHDGDPVHFRCPCCNGINTGVNPQTNLARCFSCRKNYNTIDLVIAVHRLSFIDSVAYLKKLKNTAFYSAQSVTRTPTAPDRPEAATRHENPVALGDILESIVSPSSSTSQLPTEDKFSTTTLEKRIATLETYVKILAEQIAKIERLNSTYK